MPTVIYVLATGAMCAGTLSRLVTSSLSTVPTAIGALFKVGSLRGGVLSLVGASLPQWAGRSIVHEYFEEASLPLGTWDDLRDLRHLSRSVDTGVRMQHGQEKRQNRHQQTIIASGRLRDLCGASSYVVSYIDILAPPTPSTRARQRRDAINLA